MNWRPVLAYFARPFPSRRGFAAYRMPGPVFHLSLAALAFLVGLSICIPGNALRTAPLLAVWVIAGFYLGRDLAILAHYNGLLLLAWMGGLITVLIHPQFLESLHRSLAVFSNAHYPEVAVLSTAFVLISFALWVRLAVRTMSGGEG